MILGKNLIPLSHAFVSSYFYYIVIINIIIIIYPVDTAIQRLHNWALMCVRETNCNFCCIEFYFIFITLRRQNPSFFLRN